MSEAQSEAREADPPKDRAQARLIWFFALTTLLFLALWAWTELRLRAEREITRSVEAEKSVLEGEAQLSGMRERFRSRRTGISLAGLSKVTMSAVEQDAEARGRVYLDGTSGRIFGFFEGLDTSRGEMTYQLWLRPVENPPESVGTVTFDQDGEGIVTSTGLPPGNVTGEFVLTLEQSGGALVPTGRDILRGSLESAGAIPEDPAESDS